MLHYEIINSPKQFSDISHEWEALALIQNCPSVFSDFSWMESWWRHFGSNKNLYIVAVRQSGSLICIAPLFYTSLYGIKLIQFIGRPGADYNDILIHPDHLGLAGEIWEYIVHNWGNAILKLDGITKESPSYNFFLAGESKLDRSIHKRIIYNAPFVNITQNWVDYENSIKKRLVQDTARQRRRLNGAGELQFSNISDKTEVRDLMVQMIKQKIQRFKSTGAKNIFKDKRYKAFYIDISNTFFDKGYLDLSHIKFMGQILAIHFGFHYGNKFFYYMPSFDLAFGNYSPSRILLHNLIQKSFDEHHKEFDFLSGDEAYKYDWTDSYRQVYGISIYPNNIRGKLLALVYTYVIPKIKGLTLTKELTKALRKL